MGKVLQKVGSSKQVKKNATSCLLDRFAGRNEESGKPASFWGEA